MALVKSSAAKSPTSDAKKPAFETMDAEGNSIEDAGETGTVSAQTPKQKLEAAAFARAQMDKPLDDTPISGPIVVAGANALTLPIAKCDPFKALENVFPVQFNTLSAIMATNGNFLQKDTSKPMGDTIGLEVISTQKHWVLSPGGDSNDDESLQFVKYSDDGITSQDGENMLEMLRLTKDAGYDKAKIAERTILVGSLFFAGKLPDLVDTMIQIDLPPTSAAHFARHRLSAAFNVSKGKISAEGQERLKLECTVKTKGKMNWTEVVFSQFK